MGLFQKIDPSDKAYSDNNLLTHKVGIQETSEKLLYLPQI